jgi:glucokinase
VGEVSCLAIDVGGTKLAAGVVDGEGRVLAHAQVPTEATADPEALFSSLLELVGSLRDAGPWELVGVGTGGPMDLWTGTISPLNIPAWREFPLRARLEEALGLPVALDNDAKALVLGERWRGAGRGHDNFMAMVVSTGVGGGIVLDGRLLDGRLGNAGHLGHLVVEPGGRRCRCGVRGCLEAEASGSAIEAITGRPAAEADEAMRRRCGELVGRAVASVVTLLDLDLVAVAGSVALRFGDCFFEAANESLELCTGLAFTEGARIVPAALGDLGPLVGAAAVGFAARGRLVR